MKYSQADSPSLKLDFTGVGKVLISPRVAAKVIRPPIPAICLICAMFPLVPEEAIVATPP